MSELGFIALLRQHVRSVWVLELLLLMRNHPDRRWRPEELVRELRASASLVSEALKRLRDAQLIAVEEAGVCFAPATLELARFCDDLAGAYRTKPVAVINLIAAPSQVKDLANAFKFKGDRD